MIFESVAQLKLATLTAGQLVSTKGYYASGDGGAADYIVAATQAVDGYGDHALVGGTVALLQYSGSANVKQFGAKGDGVTDDTLVLVVMLTVGGSVFFPSGTYLTDTVVFNNVSNIHFTGENRSNTVIKLNAGQNSHVINYINAFDCSVESLTIFQDYTNNPTGGHGLRLAGTENIVFRDLIIKDAYSYGIGIQDGSNINTLITDFIIDNCGRDGIDIKDYNSENSLTISNGFITGHGRDAGVLQQAGIDVRGHAVVTNVHIEATNNNQTKGLRLRQGGSQGHSGRGSFSNIYYRSVGFTNGGNVGLEIGAGTPPDEVTNYVISGFTIEGGGIGALLNGGGGVINGLSIKDTASDGISYGGNSLTINGLHIEGAGVRAIDVEVGADTLIVNGFNFTNITQTDCVRIQVSTDNSFFNGNIDSGSRIGDGGTGTTIQNVRNHKTSANLISTDIPVDSVAVVPFGLTYGLGTGITPNFEDVTLSVSRSTGAPLDYELGYVHVDSITSSTINGRVNVVTASATVGAAIKVSAMVRTKNS